ncbi:MAG TPA: HAD hydrolase family protein [Candidatus Binatia bacterium]|nr:HAD hydrolase family protein [Candidatus Binatia bacterium]
METFQASARRKAANIRLLLLDVDGVLTDGRIIIDDRGNETKQFHVRDGQGIALLKHCGIDVGFISGRRSDVVRHRAKDLSVSLVVQGVQDKLLAYGRIKRKTQLADEQIAYVGDDIIDLPVLRAVGLAVTVSDGWAELKPYVDYVTLAPGGMGAVREVAELLLKAQKRWAALLPH